MSRSPLNLYTLAGESTDGVSSTSVYIVDESIPSAAADTGRNGAFNVGTPLKDDPHFFRQFDQKEQQPPSMDASCKNTNTNCSRTNAAYESLLTMTSRATQHAGNIVDSHSATTSASYKKLKTISSITPGSASSQLSETTIVDIERMVVLREDALLSSSKNFSQRTSIFKKMMKKSHGKFFLFFIIILNFF